MIEFCYLEHLIRHNVASDLPTAKTFTGSTSSTLVSTVVYVLLFHLNRKYKLTYRDSDCPQGREGRARAREHFHGYACRLMNERVFAVVTLTECVKYKIRFVSW